MMYLKSIRLVLTNYQTPRLVFNHKVTDGPTSKISHLGAVGRLTLIPGIRLDLCHSSDLAGDKQLRNDLIKLINHLVN